MGFRVLIHDNLLLKTHISNILSDAYRMHRIKNNISFNFLQKDIKKLITTMIKPNLEYGEVV